MYGDPGELQICEIYSILHLGSSPRTVSVQLSASPISKGQFQYVVPPSEGLLLFPPLK